MKTETYWSLMKDTSDKTNPILNEAIKSSECISTDPDLLQLPTNRIQNPSKLRAYIARFVYEAIERSENRTPEDEKWRPLAAASELELMSMYYLNQVLDTKGGVHEKKDFDRNIIAAGIARDLALETLRREYNGNTKPSRVSELSDLMLNADKIFHEGEYIDVFQNTFPIPDARSFDEGIRLCDKRIYQINASFFEKIAQMATVISSTEDKTKIDAAREFGRGVGMLVQIVNDVADFVPSDRGTCEKFPSDCYADIKHGKLTYPTIWTLHHGSSEDKKELTRIFEIGEQAPEEALKKLTKRLLNNGSIDFAVKKAKQFADQAKKELQIFPREIRSPLSMTCGMASNNRYYRVLNSMKTDKTTENTT